MSNTIKTKTEIENWLVLKLSTLLKIDPESVQVDAPFVRYNMDSVLAVRISLDLGKWLGFTIRETLAWEYPNIRLMAEYLEVEQQNQNANKG